MFSQLFYIYAVLFHWIMNISGGSLFFFADFLDCTYIPDTRGYRPSTGPCHRSDRASSGSYPTDGSHCYRCSAPGGRVPVQWRGGSRSLRKAGEKDRALVKIQENEIKVMKWTRQSKLELFVYNFSTNIHKKKIEQTYPGHILAVRDWRSRYNMSQCLNGPEPARFYRCTQKFFRGWSKSPLDSH